MKSLLKIFKDSAKSLASNPLFFLPPIVSIIFLTIFSMISVKVNYAIGNDNSAIITSWNLIIFPIISFIFLGYISAGAIYICFYSERLKVKIKDFFAGAKKFWFKSFIIILVIYFVSGLAVPLLYFVSRYLSTSSLALHPELFRLALSIIGIIWLLCTVIFLTFANFFLIHENTSIVKSIRKSASFVRANYLSVLFIFLVFFIVLNLISYLDIFEIGGLTLAELISGVIIVPYILLVLSRFLLMGK